MGTEVIFLTVPLVLLHAIYLIHSSTAPERRFRSYVLGLAGLGAIAAIILNAGGSLRYFLVFGSFFYILVVVPAALISSLLKKAK